MHHKTRAIQWTSACLVSLMLAACGGGGGNDSGSTPPTGTGSPAPSPSASPAPTASPAPSPTATPTANPPPNLSADPDFQKALTLWRNDNLAKHPKGSCAGCHGADFFDLARIGSTDEDLVRRAKIDGASQEEADALVAAINKMRTAYKMPSTNARAFRPFQPGGAVLLPGLADAPHVESVKRDIAMGQQLEKLLPTLFGGRIDSLEKAKKARDELLDLAKGSNAAGANTAKLNLRSLPTGITYPLWSADVHHGAAEGTMNDWVADIAHDPKPEFKAQWTALQDTYLANPSTENFWKMYVAALSMTQVPLAGPCATDGNRGCEFIDDFNKNKFLSALIGQHLLRQEVLGGSDFTKGNALAFSYLDKDPALFFYFERPTGSGQSPGHLPGTMWEVGDFARAVFELNNAPGSLRTRLGQLGFPKFVQDSVSAERNTSIEQHTLRMPWFWIGFTFDPSFNRVHKSNSTKVAEYMVGSLLQENMFMHNTFMTHMRLVSKGFLPEGNMAFQTRPNRVEVQPFNFYMDYSYFLGYGRQILTWNEDARLGITVAQSLKDQQANLWHRFTANGFRMSMYLQLEALEQEPLKSDTKQLAMMKDMLQDTVDPNNGQLRRGSLYVIHSHFAKYQPQHDAADDALIAALAAKAGVAVPNY
jgi:hypothetical protein